MEPSQKRKISCVVIALFGLLLLFEAVLTNNVPKEESVPELKKAPMEQITFWYTGDENQAFFEACARDYEGETGIAVSVMKQQSLNYFSGIYGATAEGEDFPDVYLLEGEELERAYYSQLAAHNRFPEKYTEGSYGTAVAAASCQDKLIGYPLYFETYVFAFHNGYFEAPPASIQEMLSFSAEHDPGEGVLKLFEWNLLEGFHNFAFFGAGEEFTEKEKGMIETSRNEEIFAECAHMFGLLSDTIALVPDEISEDSIINDFVGGKTVAILLDTDRIKDIEGVDATVVPLPALNENVPMKAAARTVMLCVNQLSDQTEAAAGFADYVASKKIGGLETMTGHLPVEKDLLTGEHQKIAGQQYEIAMPLPDGLNAADYWVKFQNTVLKIWNGTE